MQPFKCTSGQRKARTVGKPWAKKEEEGQTNKKSVFRQLVVLDLCEVSIANKTNQSECWNKYVLYSMNI